MAENGRKTVLNNGETWPLHYVADPEVAAINPNYASETGKTYPFVPMENVREQCEGFATEPCLCQRSDREAPETVGYEVSPDGQKFLVPIGAFGAPLQVVVNWQAGLKG